MSRRVVIVGSGASGTAAAHAASLEGARVTVVLGRPGATALGSGALNRPAGESSGDDRQAFEGFLQSLGTWQVSAGGCRVATSSGILREARGRDRAVLDLALASPGTVGVIDDGRLGWDAAALARAWSDEPWARVRGYTFAPMRIDVLRFADEVLLPDPDLARRLDDPERVRWLADRLRGSPELPHATALLFGSWLGVRKNVADMLAHELGIPVGEALGKPGGVAGMRFEAARDAHLAERGVDLVGGWVRAVRAGSRALEVTLESQDVIEADAVVLAIGGVASGGVAFASTDPSESTEASGERGFAPSLACDAVVALAGDRLLVSGSPRGPLFEPFAWSGGQAASGFERVGVWADRAGRARNADGDSIPGLYVAGDAVADAPRTLLGAIRSGLAVGALAAREP